MAAPSAADVTSPSTSRSYSSSRIALQESQTSHTAPAASSSGAVGTNNMAVLHELLITCCSAGDVALVSQTLATMHAAGVAVPRHQHAKVIRVLAKRSLSEALAYLQQRIPADELTDRDVVAAMHCCNLRRQHRQALQLVEDHLSAGRVHFTHRIFREASFAAVRSGAGEDGVSSLWQRHLQHLEAAGEQLTGEAAARYVIALAELLPAAPKVLDAWLPSQSAGAVDEPAASVTSHPVYHKMQRAVQQAVQAYRQCGAARYVPDNPASELRPGASASPQQPVGAADPAGSSGHKMASFGVACRVLLDAACKACDHETVSSTLSIMNELGLALTGSAYTSLANYAVRRGAPPSAVEDLLSEMLCRQMAPALQHYTLLAYSYALHGDDAACLQLLQRARRAGLAPNALMYNHVLRGMSMTGAVS